MGTSFSKKVNDKNKASRAALQVPAKESSDYIPFLPTARIEEYVYCKKSKITNSGRVYETEKYDFYHNLSDKMTNGLDQYKLKEIKFEDFETVNSNPLDISNNGLVKITMGMEEWKRKTRRVQGPYSDQKFIPSESSVLGNQSVDGNNLRVVFKYPYIVWDRPFMYSLRKMKNIQNWEKFRKSGQKNDKITFFRDDKLSFTDVYQGVLPNSHFFSALIVIAKSSQDIEGSIFHQKTDMRGVFGFLFNLKAKWTIISVDDNIPFFKRTMALEDLKERNPGKKVTPRFRLDFLSARAETKLLWPLLMEKAYAKTAGSYMNLAMSSDAGLVLTDLTGCPTEMKEMQDLPSSDILWQELTRASQKGHKICALSIDNEECQKIFQNEFNQFRKNVNNRVYGDFPYKIGQDDFMVEYLGMFPNQVYPILSIKDDQRGRSIVTLDPRGRLKYKSNINSGAGKTSNYCNHQSKLLRGKDRLFKIPLSDFSKLFSKIYICYCQPNLMSTTVTANFNGNTFSCFRLKFDSPGDYYIRVSQESHLRKPGEARVKYDVIQILLAKVNEYNEYEFIEGKIEGFRDVWMRVEDIEADSDYNLYVRVNSEKKKKLGMCFTGYGNVMAEKLMHFPSELPSESDFSYQIALALSSKLWQEENEELRPISTSGDKKDLVHMLIQDSSDGFGVALFRNRSYRKKFKLRLPNYNYVYPMSIRSEASRKQVIVHTGEDIIVVWDCSEVAGLRMGIDVIEMESDDLNKPQ